jgi:Rrf2 family iron-sulfur cluster assembly transcriptional regulator
MKISAQEEYGIRILIRVARCQDPAGMSIPQLSEAEGLTQHYVAKLTRVLRLAGFINSTPGYKGGYVLARQTSEIVIKDVLSALGGPIFDAKFCSSHSGVMKLCTNSVDCSARSLWQMIQFTVNQLLEKVTLYDLVSGEKESEKILKELIMNSSKAAVEKLALNQM